MIISGEYRDNRAGGLLDYGFEMDFEDNMSTHGGVGMDTGIISSILAFQNELYQKYDPYSFVPRDNEQEEEHASAKEVKRMRTMLRELLKPEEKSRDHVGRSSQGNLFDELAGAVEKDDEKEKPKKISNYNYKEVANKIRQAKTSLSAAQAVIAARRKVAEVKRKIANGDGDPEELQLDLTHARRMEIAAGRKRHNLELEELIKRTMAGDEKQEKMEEASEDVRQALTEMSEEDLLKQEDEIFEERQDMLDEAMESFGDARSELSDDMLADINALIAAAPPLS